MSITSEAVNFAQIYRETIRRLDVLSLRVQEGKDVQGASEFCRWLDFSGIPRLLEANANKETGLLKVDGAFLRWRCNELQERCNDYLQRGQADLTFSAAYLQTMHEKLESTNRKIDLVAGYLSKLSVAPSVVTNSPSVESEPIRGLNEPDLPHNESNGLVGARSAPTS